MPVIIIISCFPTRSEELLHHVMYVTKYFSNTKIIICREITLMSISAIGNYW